MLATARNVTNVKSRTSQSESKITKTKKQSYKTINELTPKIKNNLA